jgi:hypothetical protein
MRSVRKAEAAALMEIRVDDTAGGPVGAAKLWAAEDDAVGCDELEARYAERLEAACGDHEGSVT